MKRGRRKQKGREGGRKREWNREDGRKDGRRERGEMRRGEAYRKGRGKGA